MKKQKINKLKTADLVEEYIAVRKQRNVKTTKQEAIEAVADIFNVLENLLEQEDVGITLGKTGVLYNAFQKGRLGRHPQNGTPLDIPDLRTLRFKPAPKYKEDQLNGH